VVFVFTLFFLFQRDTLQFKGGFLSRIDVTDDDKLSHLAADTGLPLDYAVVRDAHSMGDMFLVKFISKITMSPYHVLRSGVGTKNLATLKSTFVYCFAYFRPGLVSIGWSSHSYGLIKTIYINMVLGWLRRMSLGMFS
jgi:hypothetical protein